MAPMTPRPSRPRMSSSLSLGGDWRSRRDFQETDDEPLLHRPKSLHSDLRRLWKFGEAKRQGDRHRRRETPLFSSECSSSSSCRLRQRLFFPQRLPLRTTLPLLFFLLSSLSSFQGVFSSEAGTSAAGTSTVATTPTEFIWQARAAATLQALCYRTIAKAVGHQIMGQSDESEFKVSLNNPMPYPMILEGRVKAALGERDILQFADGKWRLWEYDFRGDDEELEMKIENLTKPGALREGPFRMTIKLQDKDSDAAGRYSSIAQFNESSADTSDWSARFCQLSNYVCESESVQLDGKIRRELYVSKSDGVYVATEVQDLRSGERIVALLTPGVYHSETFFTRDNKRVKYEHRHSTMHIIPFLQFDRRSRSDVAAAELSLKAKCSEKEAVWSSKEVIGRTTFDGLINMGILTTILPQIKGEPTRRRGQKTHSEIPEVDRITEVAPVRFSVADRTFQNTEFRNAFGNIQKRAFDKIPDNSTGQEVWKEAVKFAYEFPTTTGVKLYLDWGTTIKNLFRPGQGWCSPTPRHLTSTYGHHWLERDDIKSRFRSSSKRPKNKKTKRAESPKLLGDGDERPTTAVGMGTPIALSLFLVLSAAFLYACSKKHQKQRRREWSFHNDS